jgi:NADH-quinone oxidoreductase subunit J
MIIYQYIAEALFFAFIFLVFFGSLLAVRTQLLMHAVLGLAVSLLGVAGLYFYLGSIFLTLMQILIYVGAVCIVIVFGIMVGYSPSQVAARNISAKNSLLAITAGLSAFILFITAIGRTLWVPAAAKTGDFSLAYIGQNLLYKYCLVFELISVVLLTAIVGSILLARGGREEIQ